LEELSSLNDGKKISTFMDNMRVHRSKIAHEAYARLKIVPIFNIPYSPQFNGIESVFSIMKEKYKRAMMEKIVHGEKFRP
jgi:transposase